MEFKNIKLVEKLHQLDCPEVVKVMAVNRFGPDSLEMVSIPIFLRPVYLHGSIFKRYINEYTTKYSFWSSHLIITCIIKY